MTTKKLSEQVGLDPSGRVKLSDEELEKLLGSEDLVVSGGSGTINDVCNNSGDCTGSTNTSSCTNSLVCDGALNAPRNCTMPKDVPGG